MQHSHVVHILKPTLEAPLHMWHFRFTHTVCKCSYLLTTFPVCTSHRKPTAF